MLIIGLYITKLYLNRHLKDVAPNISVEFTSKNLLIWLILTGTDSLGKDRHMSFDSLKL